MTHTPEIDCRLTNDYVYAWVAVTHRNEFQTGDVPSSFSARLGQRPVNTQFMRRITIGCTGAAVVSFFAMENLSPPPGDPYRYPTEMVMNPYRPPDAGKPDAVAGLDVDDRQVHWLVSAASTALWFAAVLMLLNGAFHLLMYAAFYFAADARRIASYTLMPLLMPASFFAASSAFFLSRRFLLGFRFWLAVLTGIVGVGIFSTIGFAFSMH